MPREQDRNKSSWVRIIESVRTPLSFFTLILLITEGILLYLVSKSSGTDFTLLVIGIIFLLFAIVFIVGYSFLKQDPTISTVDKAAELEKDFTHLGLVGLTVAYHEFGTDNDWALLLANAKNVIDILGFSMRELMDNEELIKIFPKLVANPNLQFHIILASPNSMSVRERAFSLSMDTDELVKRIYQSYIKLSDLIKPEIVVAGKREVRTFSDIVVPYSLIRVDGKMLIIPYLSSTEKKNSPILIIEGQETELFKRYEADFNKIWKRTYPLHNPRVRVPIMYTKISSEKDAIADSVVTIFEMDNVHFSSGFKCLDIGCGDGTQSILTFSKLVAKIPGVEVTFLDPSTYAIQACEEILTQQRILFRERHIDQGRWQEYEPNTKFHFIFCCHVLGAIYQQCTTDSDFRSEFERIMSSLENDGRICVILASEKSIELQLRKRERNVRKGILSAELLAEKLDYWGIKYELQHVNSFLTLQSWLGNIGDNVRDQEKEIMHFLFSPSTDITRDIADRFRSGLRNTAKTWGDMKDEEKKRYMGTSERSSEYIRDNSLFVEMQHVAFWIKPD